MKAIRYIIHSAFLFICATSLAQQTYDVVWADLVNVTNDGNTITKTSRWKWKLEWRCSFFK